MQVVSVHEVKANLAEYLDKVERGETLVIARHDKPIAELRPVPETGTPKHRRPGLARGKISIAPDAFAPISEEELADWYEIRPEDPLHPDWKQAKD